MGLQRRPGSNDAFLQVLQILKGMLSNPVVLSMLTATDRAGKGAEPEPGPEGHQL